MKSLWILVCLSLMAGAVPALGANPDVKPSPNSMLISPGELTPTPEMWFYQQDQQQYANPQAMVRQKADIRATERQRRLDAMKWYGFSNQRPRTGTDPINGDYGPSWTSGNGLYPARWQPYAAPWIISPPQK